MQSALHHSHMLHECAFTRCTEHLRELTSFHPHDVITSENLTLCPLLLHALSSQQPARSWGIAVVLPQVVVSLRTRSCTRCRARCCVLHKRNASQATNRRHHHAPGKQPPAKMAQPVAMTQAAMRMLAVSKAMAFPSPQGNVHPTKKTAMWISRQVGSHARWFRPRVGQP